MADKTPADLAADFLALGYCYLQVELLTRQMRYASNLDEGRFRRHVVDGAKAATSGDATEAHRCLTVCFNLLGEERDHYYSVDAYLIDLTLVAETTVGPALRRELQCGVPLNLMLSGETLAHLEMHAPETLAALHKALNASTVGLIGGEYREEPMPLKSLEAELTNLRRGLSEFERILSHACTYSGGDDLG